MVNSIEIHCYLRICAGQPVYSSFTLCIMMEKSEFGERMYDMRNITGPLLKSYQDLVNTKRSVVIVGSVYRIKN